jgi:hypothetical protein
MSAPNALLLEQMLLGLGLGSVIGVAFFATLQRNIELYVVQGRARAAIAIHILRLVSVTAAFALIVQFGAAALLGAFASFLMLRTVMTHRVKSSS